MIDFIALKKQLDGHALIRSMDTLPKGHVRIETAFLYPEGSSIDVFVVEEGPLLSSVQLTDLGQTMSWLLDVQVRPWLSKKRQRFIDDALHIYGVTQNKGALELPMQTVDGIVDGIVRLGQACVRVADLAYTRRLALQASFTEEVEEFLADAELQFEPNVELEGRHRTTVRVDFMVRGPRVASALLTLASANASQAHVQANEIFRRWYDLNIPERLEQRVTVFDDRSDAYREDDLRRLRDVSDVIALSERQALKDVLAA